MKKKIFALFGTAMLLSSCSLIDDIFKTKDSSSDEQQETPTDTPTLTLEKSEGYTVKFNNINANYYIVKDSNDYRDEIKITGNKTDEYFYYTPEVVGEHNIYIKAYDKNNKINIFKLKIIANKKNTKISIDNICFFMLLYILSLNWRGGRVGLWHQS